LFACDDDDDSNGKLTFDKNGVEVFVGEETVVNGKRWSGSL